MKKVFFIVLLVTGINSLAQNLQTVTTNGATTTVPITVTTSGTGGAGVSSITGNSTNNQTGIVGASSLGIGVNAISGCSEGVSALSNTGTSGLFSMGTTAKGIVINSNTDSTGDFFTLNKNGLTKLVVNQAGEMTAYKFIKEGGTSSQFLKANGDVDSNTYLTTLNAISILFPNGFPTFTAGGGIVAPSVQISNGIPNSIVSFDSNKNLVGLSTLTYPSLTELAYLKGLTSPIQAQLIGKQNVLTLTTTGTTGGATFNGSVLNIPQYAGSIPTQTITNGVTTTAPSEDAVFDALALKANIASPLFTGIPAAPTAAAGTNTTQLATTAFVRAADNLKANIASPTFTGVPAAPTAAAGTNTTQLATTAFVTTANNLKANIASPTFTGTPTLPTGTIGVTQIAGNSSTAIATTAFVTAANATKQNSSPNLTALSGLSFFGPFVYVRMTAAGTFDLDPTTYYPMSNPFGFTSNKGTVTNVSPLTLGTSGTDISSSVATGTTTPVITLNVPTASATNRGALSSADWSSFNNKQNALTLTTIGTSGSATFTGSTLNIPQYTGSDGNWTLATTDITNNNLGNVNVKLNATKKFSFLNSTNTVVGDVNETGLGTFGNTTMNLIAKIGPLGGNQFLSGWRSQANFNLNLGNPQISQPFGFNSTNYFGTSYVAGSNEVSGTALAEHSFNIGNSIGNGITSGIFRIGRTRLQSTVPMKYATDLSASYDNRTLVDKEYVDTKVATTTGAQSLQSVTTVGGTTDQLITINPTGISILAGDISRSALTVTNSDTYDSSGLTYGTGITGSGSTGVHGINSYGNGNGVYGESNGGDPLIGVGVRGVSDLGKGVVGTSTSGIGVLGYSQNIGISASSETTGIQVQVSPSALEAIKVIMNGSANGLVLNSTTTSTGNPIEVKKDNISKLVVNQAGEITASKIIKSGGLATQYLMADGSTTTGGGSTPTQTITNGVTTTAPSEDAVFDALALKANLASPIFTGTPTLPTGTIGVTQIAGDSSTAIATTAFVTTALSNLATRAITVRKISTATTLSNNDNATVILLTGSCTVTIPNGLSTGFNCSFATQAGATLTYLLGGSVTLINSSGLTMPPFSSHTIVNTGVSNEYLTVGL